MQAFTAYLTSLNTTAEALLANTSLLTSVLYYHIVPAPVRTAIIPNGTSPLPTFDGRSVTAVKNASGVTVNGAKIIQANVAAGFSVVHVMDKVLVPPPAVNIAAALAARPALSTFAQAVALSPSISAIANNRTAAVTVFAPTVEASDPAARVPSL
jgi:uncharacterized surface protein with fasciclin (FAS1) repeats